MTEHQARLESLKAHVLEELDLLKDQADPVALDQPCIGRVARIDAIQQNEMAKSNLRYFQSQLLEVNAALQRLEDDEYGFCEECGVDIPDARLAIKPEVRFCVAARKGMNPLTNLSNTRWVEKASDSANNPQVA